MKKTIALLLALILAALCAPAAFASEEASPPVSGMLLHSYANADYPARPAMLPKEMREQADKIAKFAKSAGYNAILYEVRPSGDAMYKSVLFPTSAYYAGTQGRVIAADPLEILISQAKKQQIQVLAVINPYYMGAQDAALHPKSPAYQNPESTVNLYGGLYLDPRVALSAQIIADGAAEVAARYDISGVIVSDIDNSALNRLDNYYEHTGKMLQMVYHSVTHYNPTLTVGAIVSGDTVGEAEPARAAMLSSLAGANALDWVLPEIRAEAGDNHIRHSQALTYWGGLRESGNVKILPVSSFYMMEQAGQDAYLPAINLIANFDGNIHSGYSSLSTQKPQAVPLDLANLYVPPPPPEPEKPAEQPSGTAALEEESDGAVSAFVPVDSGKIVPIFGQDGSVKIQGLDFTIPAAFAIANPSQKLTTTYAKYYITGTSNPNASLYMDGKEIQRTGTKGTWGVLVSLKSGTNKFSFTQGGKTLSATIVRKTDAAVTKITKITQSSAYPRLDDAVYSGETITLKCTAPAGGVVTAQVNGKTVELKQVALAEDGTPATFNGKLEITGFDDDRVTEIGEVTYKLSYKGNSTSVKTTGKLFAVGAGADLVVEIDAYYGNVLKDSAKEGVYLTTLKQGCVDYVVGKNTTHFELSSGGWLPKEDAKILTGKQTAQNKVQGSIHQKEAGAESFVLYGTRRPAFHARMDKQSLTVTLFNTTEVEPISAQGSNLISSVALIPDGTAVQLVFTAQPSQPIWGYDVSFENEKTIITIKKTPRLSSNGEKPLQGVVVVLDPGHGGKDPGALGIPGTKGPDEQTINMGMAALTKAHLEALGATVQMTRYANDRVTLDERLEISRLVQADLFISLHSNSVGYTSDGNKAEGTEVYYHNELSPALSQMLSGAVSGAFGFKDRGATQSYYRVTRTTLAPAVMAEMGFVVNPAEYEVLCNPTRLNEAAKAIADTVVRFLE